MCHLVFHNVSREFVGGGDRFAGLRDFSVEACRGQIQVWLGPSGSGKTTAARIVSGLEREYTGEVLLGDRDLRHVPPHRRTIELGVYHVFQTPGLYPHLSLERNILFGLREVDLDARQREERLDEAIRLLFPDYSADARVAFLKKKPHQLSGGERQRTALAKAVLRRPNLLILDEPLSNVDAPLRVDIRRGLRRWQRVHNSTVIWITHDQHEAVAVGDTMAVIDSGRVLQVGTARELFEQPAHRRVAHFVSAGLGLPLNYFRGRIERGGDDAERFVCSQFAVPVETER